MVASASSGARGSMSSRDPPPIAQFSGDSTEKTTKSVAAVVPAEPPAPVPTEVGTLGQRLEATRKQLRELEAEAAAKRPAATLHGLTTLKGELGPTVTATVHIDGVPTEALIDTGSPSTIVSLEYAMCVLRNKLPQFTNEEQWQAFAVAEMKLPTVALKSYGGDELFLIGQWQVCLSTPGHTLNTVVQVQKDPPVKLLLGTDAQAALGFGLIQSDSDGAMTDLLCPGQWRKEPELDQTPVDAAVQDPSLAEVEPVVEVPQAEQETGEVSPAVVAPRQTASGEAPDSRTIPETHSVRLLQATKVPPRYKKVVRARVNGVNGFRVAV